MENKPDISILLSVVVSVYNEEESLPAFWPALKAVLDTIEGNKEVIFVDDGSVDESIEILKKLAADEAEIRVISFSRNFGHEAAMLAGVDAAKGEAVICMDADLQHPPEKIPEMLVAWKEGNHIVNMVRKSRSDHNFFQRAASSMFYWFINRISPVRFEPNASDFFLISRKVAKVLKKEYRERTRFLRGYIQIVGFSKTKLTFDAGAREAGESKYGFGKLLILSAEAIVAFSRVPLHLGLIGGIVCALGGFVVIIYTLYTKFFSDDPMPAGYATIIILMSFLFSFLFFLIGIMGVYIGYIFEESRKRPIYIVDEVYTKEPAADV